MHGARPAALAPSGPAEEWIDERVHRPLAARLVGPLAAWGITPDQVTVAAGLAGVGAGALVWLAVDRPPVRAAAALLLFVAVVLDCADGQLARARGTSSRAGEMLDGLADLAVNASVLGAVAYTLARQSGAAMGLVGVAAMVSYGVQCSLFDFAKRAYLAQAGARPLPTGRDLGEIEASAAHARGEGRGAAAFLLRFFVRYSAAQQRMVRALPGLAPAPFPRARMRAWTALGLGTHLAIVYGALAISAVWPPALAAAMILFATAGNVLLGVLVWPRPAKALDAPVTLP